MINYDAYSESVESYINGQSISISIAINRLLVYEISLQYVLTSKKTKKKGYFHWDTNING